LENEIDQKTCDSHARCKAPPPELYALDEAGLAGVTEVGRRRRPEARRAAMDGALNCAENAITVTYGIPQQ
jgi:ferredoxin